MMFFSYQRGDRGQVVRDIQQALNTTQAAGLEVDGIYGQQTDKAVTKIANYQNNSSRAASPAVFTEIGIPQIAIADISDHQYQVDFHKLRASGVRGVIIKASEGFDWKTKKIERFKEAKDAGLLVGAYHFGRPDLHDEDDAPQIERANFDEVIERAGVRLDFLPVYDFEKGDKTRDEWSVHYCLEWKPGIIYTARWAIDSLAGREADHLMEAGASLWFADYRRGNDKRYPTDSTRPWAEWSLWQHTASELTEAVTDRHGEPSKIDMNWTHRGRLRELLQKGCKV